jgi:hypothetical protein
MTKARKGPNKAGRPVMEPSQKKEQRVEFRVNIADYAELCRLRDLSGRDLSAFIREAALGCVIKAPPSLANRDGPGRRTLSGLRAARGSEAVPIPRK